jgi:hypothetical protein
MGKKNKGHRRRRSNARKNPFSFFGGPAKPAVVAEAAVGVLAGLAIARAVINMLPASLTSTTLSKTASSIAIAIGEWWLLSMVSPTFGAAAGLGGIAYAGNSALNAVMPEVGSYTGVSGMGDFVKGRFSVPQNPVLDGNTGSPIMGSLMSAAYPPAYGMQ